MTQAPPAPAFQVTLLGTRLKEISDAELIAELRAKLKLSPEQAGSLLTGRRTVKRGVELAAAQRLVGIFTQIGLKAVVENMPAPAPRAEAPAKPIVKETSRQPAPEQDVVGREGDGARPQILDLDGRPQRVVRGRPQVVRRR